MNEGTTVFTSAPASGIARITLNRPERLNALSWPMIDELHATLSEVAADPDVRVVVLDGAGRGFCSGIDLDEIGPGDDVTEMLRRQELVASLAPALRRLPQPVIAAVDGPAAGGGLALALACDMRVCSPAARFNVAFVRIGLSGCDVGVSYLLPRLVGHGMASEMMLTGRFVEADEALRIGLANRVVDAGELDGAALELAGQIAANSEFGVRMTKRVLDENGSAASLEAAIELENRTQVLALAGPQAAAALAAFRARR